MGRGWKKYMDHVSVKMPRRRKGEREWFGGIAAIRVEYTVDDQKYF